MIRPPLFLIANRPDIRLVVWHVVPGYQAKAPTEKHPPCLYKGYLNTFRGTINRGLWYPKDSSIALTAYADADHADLNSKEATLQVVYDVLKLTPFYKAFQITADVPEIYMQEFWATATVHHHSIRFKMNNKKHIVNLEDLGHSREIKVIIDVNVNKLHQPWRSFAAVINKCLSENKNVKRSNEMYYPRFTKVIINFFMTKDQSIPRRNKVNWHFARDDYMFTMIKVVSRHEDTQLYGVILPDELMNEAIKDSESYKEYYAIASGAEPPKTKASAAKTAKKKQPTKTSKAKGLTVLSEVALTEVEQMKLATKRSLIESHSSHASYSAADKGTGSKPGVPSVPTYGSDDEQISWKSCDEEDDDEVGMNDDDDDDNDDDDDDADNCNNRDLSRYLLMRDSRVMAKYHPGKEMWLIESWSRKKSDVKAKNEF
ncbi:hypothetical protein Tco_1195309 [Tanacetum coccineum]